MSVRPTTALRYAIATIAFVLLATTSLADPPAGPPPCNVTIDPLFCIRITDVERDAAEPDKFRYMFEFVNWTGSDVAEILVMINTGPNPGGDFPGAPRFSGASIDANGRPFGPSSTPPAGNGPTTSDNDWTIAEQTTSLVRFTALTAIDHPQAMGFDGLLDPDLEQVSQQVCEDVLTAMIPGSVVLPGPVISLPDPETIDDGTNARDGFILEVGEVDPEDQFSFNWYFLNEFGNVIGEVDSGGNVVGDEYGFGTFNIVRLSSTPQDPLLFGNTGYDPPDDTDPNQDTPRSWAEDEVGGVDQFPINPIPDGPGTGTYHGVEAGVAVTAEFEDLSDNVFGSGVNTGIPCSLSADCATDTCSTEVCQTNPDLRGVASTGGPLDSSTLYQIDPLSGNAGSLGSIGFAGVGAIDYHPGTGVLYGVGRRIPTGEWVLITLDDAGTGTEVGPLTNVTPDPDNFDISFREADASLFLIEGSPSAGGVTLWTIDVSTGVATSVGNTGTLGSGNGLGFSGGDVLYQVDDSSGGTLFVVDQGSGASAPSTTLSFLGFPGLTSPRGDAVEFNLALGGVAYVTVNDDPNGAGPNYLATLELETGNVTLIGPTANDLDGLAWRRGNYCINLLYSDTICGCSTVVLEQSIVAVTPFDFCWAYLADIEWVRGALSGVSGYGFDVYNTLPNANCIPAPLLPSIGEGFYYLVKPSCPVLESWQSSLGAEPGRDLALP